jgi:hypothetical protein
MKTNISRLKSHSVRRIASILIVLSLLLAGILATSCETSDPSHPFDTSASTSDLTTSPIPPEPSDNTKTEPQPTTTTGLSFEIEDYAAAVENILLAITAEGYAAVWMDGAVNLEDRRERIKKLLQVPDDRCVRAIIPLGRPEKEVAQREKMPLEERVKWLR